MWASRKSKTLITLLLFVLVTAQLATGCASDGTTGMTTSVTPPVTTTTFGSPEVVEGQIDVYHVHVESSLISFSGTAGFPDDTTLHSRLYEDETSLSWWPDYMDIVVQNGRWTASVDLDMPRQVKNILVGPRYHFEVWLTNNPANKSGIFFDLVGPPPFEPWWIREIFWAMIGIALGIIVIILAGIYGIMRWRYRVKTKSS